MRIVLTGGGTGGHVMPFEPIVAALRTVFLEQKDTLPERLEPTELRITFVGVADTKTEEFLRRYDIAVTHVPSGKMRRYASFLNIIDICFWLPVGIIKALLVMWQIMPEVVISKGGYGSVPTVLAARFYRIPVLLHESDAMPGLANRQLARFATVIALGFAAAKEHFSKKFQRRTILTGTPVRRDFFATTPEHAREELKIGKEEKVLLIVGGSQGAQQINETLLQLLPKLVLDYTILHIAGERHKQAIEAVTKDLLAQSSRKECYRLYGFADDEFIPLLQATDGVVSRAGSVVAEFVALRKPMLLIPLASAASDHQRANAQALEALGAALVLDPTNLTHSLLQQNITRLMNDEALRANLITHMQTVDFPTSGQTIATLAMKIAQGLAPV